MLRAIKNSPGESTHTPTEQQQRQQKQAGEEDEHKLSKNDGSGDGGQILSDWFDQFDWLTKHDFVFSLFFLIVLGKTLKKTAHKKRTFTKYCENTFALYILCTQDTQEDAPIRAFVYILSITFCIWFSRHSILPKH